MKPHAEIILRPDTVDQRVEPGPPSLFPTPGLRKDADDFIAFRHAEARKHLSRVRQLGWRSLLIGLVFLSVTIVLVELMKRYLPAGNVFAVVEGGLTILAWVALWRPGELLLYDWYPFRRDARLFSQLAHVEIAFIVDGKVAGG